MTSHMSRIAQGWGAAQSCAYCHGFAKIPPLIRGTDGRMHINPDFEMVKIFAVRAEPFGALLAAGASQTFSITVPAEDEDLGDLLISEFRSVFNPAGTRDLTIEILSNQTNRTFQNAPIFNTLLMGDAFLNCCLPCCTLVQATNSLLIRVTNTGGSPTQIRITAHGKRFLPKSEELRSRMLKYWNSIPSYPYFLTLDDQQVRVNSGTTVTALMTVQGNGDFEVKWPRCEVVAAAAGTPVPDDILTTITEQIGRQQQSGPLPLGAFVATPTLVVAGFPGNLYRAAAACHCPPFSQLLKRNTRLRCTFQNTGSFDAFVRLTFAGCFHEVGECPPGRSMDRIRSLEPTIGPLLIPQRDYCPPAEPLPDYYDEEIPEPWTPPAPVPPPPVPMAPAPAYAAPQSPASRRSMNVPGYGLVYEGQGGPMSYVWDYYEPGPGGQPVPKRPGGAAGGSGSVMTASGPQAAAPSGPSWRQPMLSGMAGLGNQVLRPGTPYFDPITMQWRRA